MALRCRERAPSTTSKAAVRTCPREVSCCSMSGRYLRFLVLPKSADIVAKVGEGHLERNNRIAANKFLNRYCESGLDLQSILLARMHKILLQQYLPIPDIAPNPEILFRPRGAGGYQPEAE